eukprot:COSAG02_NODE_673_length_18630_cov_7.960768_11_plen_196_part_00
MVVATLQAHHPRDLKAGRGGRGVCGAGQVCAEGLLPQAAGRLPPCVLRCRVFGSSGASRAVGSAAGSSVSSAAGSTVSAWGVRVVPAGLMRGAAALMGGSRVLGGRTGCVVLVLGCLFVGRAPGRGVLAPHGCFLAAGWTLTAADVHASQPPKPPMLSRRAPTPRASARPGSPRRSTGRRRRPCCASRCTTARRP